MDWKRVSIPGDSRNVGKGPDTIRGSGKAAKTRKEKIERESDEKWVSLTYRQGHGEQKKENREDLCGPS